MAYYQTKTVSKTELISSHTGLILIWCAEEHVGTVWSGKLQHFQECHQFKYK